MALPAGKPAGVAANNLYEELGDNTMRGYGQQEELSMESGIDPGQEYYGQDYYNYDHGYELPQYGSRRKLISPAGMYDESGEWGKKKRIKLVVDREYETSSTGDDSAPESQRNRLSNINSHSNINGNIYLAQNESIIRTRRAGHSNNLKVNSPARLGKQFKKLDKLAVTHEEKVPLNSPLPMGISSSADDNLNTRPSSGSLASSTTGPDSITSKSNKAKARNDKGWGKKKRIKLVVDREYETSSTGDDSAPESQRNRLSNINSHSNINGNIYLAQNESIIRTRRAGHSNNLKVNSPARLGKQFKKLDKLAVTHEEKVPLNSPLPMGISSSADDNLNTRPSSGSLASSTTGPDSITSKSNKAKARNDKGVRSIDEQESTVDNEDVKEPLESHSDQTHSDEEELWMGPWNNLHIPMTKL
ncbi:UNVERIFIED_CONTAM: hypothetical protein FKN15_024834 [Acipenser sinensis]